MYFLHALIYALFCALFHLPLFFLFFSAFCYCQFDNIHCIECIWHLSVHLDERERMRVLVRGKQASERPTIRKTQTAWKLEWKTLIAHHNRYCCKSINYYDRHIWVQAYSLLTPIPHSLGESQTHSQPPPPSLSRSLVAWLYFQHSHWQNAIGSTKYKHFSKMRKSSCSNELSLTQLTHFKWYSLEFFFRLFSLLLEQQQRRKLEMQNARNGFICLYHFVWLTFYLNDFHGNH